LNRYFINLIENEIYEDQKFKSQITFRNTDVNYLFHMFVSYLENRQKNFFCNIVSIGIVETLKNRRLSEEEIKLEKNQLIFKAFLTNYVLIFFLISNPNLSSSQKSKYVLK
jgi:hypothetical protein